MSMTNRESGPNRRGLEDASKLPGAKAAMAEARKLVADERKKAAAERKRAAASARQVAKMLEGETITR